MTAYLDGAALRTAIEHRLANQSRQSGISIDRLRRRIMFERIVARLDTAEPGLWVLKGGMALEVRLRDEARLTKDIDLGLRESADALADLDAFQDRLIHALAADADSDFFTFSPAAPRQLLEDGAGHRTWRVKVEARLALRTFGTVSLDISPRPHELDATERLSLPNSLAFAGIPERDIETIDTNRHAAEKLHALCRTYGERENSRVRDLLDLVLLHEHGLIDPFWLAIRIRHVWAERGTDAPPETPPSLPSSWPESYQRLATENGISTDFQAATALLEQLWHEVGPRRK